MKRQVHHRKMLATNFGAVPVVKYKYKKYTGLVSIFIGLLTVLIGYNADIGLLYDDPWFYFSCASSIGLTWLVLWEVRKANVDLDKQYPWRWFPFHRTLYQLLFAVMMPSFTILGWNYLFFEIAGIPATMHDYMLEDFPLSIVLMLILNGMYVRHYLTKVPRLSSQDNYMESVTGDLVLALPAEILFVDTLVEEAEPSDDKAAVEKNETTTSQGILAVLTAAKIEHFNKAMAFFKVVNKKTRGFYLDGSNKEGGKKIDHAVKSLAAALTAEFYLTKSGFLVNRAAIDTVIEQERRFSIRLKAPYQDERVLTKSNDKPAFREWWRGPIYKEEQGG